jgi:DNA-binding GntR family transcriptional regulator
VKVPYGELSDEPAYDTHTSNLVKFVDGEPVVVEYGQIPPPAFPDAHAVQRDNTDTTRCLEALANHRVCATFIDPDGSLGQV